MKLEGIRVIDLSLFLPGPHLTQLMADNGAEVIKVEPINGGEPNREIGLMRDDISVFFANTHRGKKSIQINLKSAAGHALFMRLVQSADVMVEAFRPGVVKRLGVDYDSIQAVVPEIVYCSISAFGQSGPYVRKPAHDLATQAYAGILSVNNGSDGNPAIPAMPSADMLSAVYGLSGVLMALLRRRDTGRGDYIDVAMMDSLVASMPNNLGPVFAEKRAPVPQQERSWGGNAMYGIYATKDDRHVAIGGAEMHFAENFLTKLGRPDLLALCAPPPGSTQEPVREFFRQTFKTRTMREWIDWCADVDMAIAPVNNLREAMDDPQVRAREMLVTDGRGWEFVGMPIKFQDEPGEQSFSLPNIGEHRDELLRELGFSDADITAAASAGAFTRSEG
jgi:crotonobetainyl-CoA:carnitine CoA-transferase CaiB-like acyl-CoA transferase